MDSDFLHVGVRIRNPHEHTAPVYWWSNIAVPEGERTRVLAPADEAWHFGYERTLTRVPVPETGSVDRTYPLLSDFPADYFYEVPDGARRWIASLDAEGRGLVQTSTDLLRGRKLFVWGNGPGGRRWQQWLTEPGTVGYAEIQAGLARTQLEHIPLEPGAEFSWLESYGPLSADPGVVHGDDWTAARAETEQRLAEALPRADVDAAYAAWRPYADTEPGESLATGSGWGALEVRRAGYKLPGTPFAESTLGEQQAPWLYLLDRGGFPEPRRVAPPGPSLVSAHWRDMLETAAAEPSPSTTSASPSGTQATVPRRSAAGNAVSPSLRPAGRCCAAWPSPPRRAASATGSPTSTARRSMTCARSAGTTAMAGRQPPSLSAARRSRRCCRPGGPRTPGRSGPG